MAVSVTLNTPSYELEQHADAVKWTVEKEGRSLVLMDENSQAVAVYGPDKWMSAAVISDYDESTLEKVYDTITEGGVFNRTAAIDIITRLQNAGILFRERPVAT